MTDREKAFAALAINDLNTRVARNALILLGHEEAATLIPECLEEIRLMAQALVDATEPS